MTDLPEAFLISYWGKRVTVEHRLTDKSLTWSTKTERQAVPCVRHTVGGRVCVYVFDKGHGKTLIRALLVIDWASNEAFYSGFPIGSASAKGEPEIDRGAVQSKYWLAAASAFPRSGTKSRSEPTPQRRVFISGSGTCVELHSGAAPALVVTSADGSTQSFSIPTDPQVLDSDPPATG
jgi:hypothetical protein